MRQGPHSSYIIIFTFILCDVCLLIGLLCRVTRVATLTDKDLNKSVVVVKFYFILDKAPN